MSARSPTPIGSIAAVAILLAWGADLGVSTNIARADDCLTAPNSPAPEGSHWYYQTDRATQRKCWYLRAKGELPQQPAAQAQSEAAPATDTPAEETATASVGSISPADSDPRVPPVKQQPAQKSSATTEEPAEGPSPKIGTQSSVPAPGVGVGGPTNIAGPDDCLTAPNSPAPQGKHWFYRTDRAIQRKCWYLRAKDQPTRRTDAQAPPAAAPAIHASAFESATASTGASMLKSSANSARPLTSVKPQPAFVSGATTQQGVEQNAPRGSIPPASPAVPAPHQAAGPAPAAAGVSPYPSADATARARDSYVASSVARPHSARPTLEARVSNNAESTARDGASTTNAAGMATSLTGTLAGMLLIVALGLGVAGLLYRVVTAVARRRQIIVHHPESNWIGDENPHHWQRHRSVGERNQFIDDSHRSPVSGANDYDVRPLHPANDEWSNNARPTGGASQITNEVSEHEERLAQLRRDLDRLLQLPKRA